MSHYSIGGQPRSRWNSFQFSALQSIVHPCSPHVVRPFASPLSTVFSATEDFHLIVAFIAASQCHICGFHCVAHAERTILQQDSRLVASKSCNHWQQCLPMLESSTWSSVRPHPTQPPVWCKQVVNAVQQKGSLLFRSFWWSIGRWWVVLCAILGSKGRPSSNELFPSFGGINTSALVVTVKDSAAITAAEERAASAAAETFPLNFSTSQCTCICRARLTALVSKYPFALMAAGIFTVITGLLEHATKKLAAPFARASTVCSVLVKDIFRTFGGPKVLLTGNSISGKRSLPRKDPLWIVRLWTLGERMHRVCVAQSSGIPL